MSEDPRKAGEQLSVVVLGDCVRCKKPIHSNQDHARWRAGGAVQMAHNACEYPKKEDHHDGDEVPGVQPGGGTA